MTTTPNEYFSIIASGFRQRLGAPVTWGHVLFTSLTYAVRSSAYGGEPLVQHLREQLKARCLEKVGPGAPGGLTDAALHAAAEAMMEYEATERPLGQLHDRVLRWLSDGPDIAGDWTLEIWRSLLAETRITARHFADAALWLPGQQAAAAVEPPAPGAWEDELASLVGLTEIKQEVRRLKDFLRIRRLRHTRNLKTGSFALHQVFRGNPGTGKTSVARILAQIYREFGFLSKGHLVETDRSGLVGQYIGATEAKTEEVIRKALGGVLFIDEAYSLAGGGNEDFGPRAIDTLVKMMEDHRKDLVVIVAGYTDEMAVFLESNSGLASRFTRFFDFPDYSTGELGQILLRFAQREDCQIDDSTLTAACNLLEKRRAELGRRFGNAREARNVWEAMLMRQAERIFACGIADKDISDDMLRQFVPEDVSF